MSEPTPPRNGHHTALLLGRAQNRIQGMIVSARNPTEKRRLTEERDALSRVKMALRRLKPEDIAVLTKNAEDFTAAESARYGALPGILKQLLAQPVARP